MAIESVGTVSVFVNDQNRAKEFYTNVLGLELRRDEPLFEGSPDRWIAVAPQGAKTEIILYKPDENWEHFRQVVGKAQALTLEVTDIAGLYEDLQAKGVTFLQKPDPQPWGTYAMIQDSEGNGIMLVEQPSGG